MLLLESMSCITGTRIDCVMECEEYHDSVVALQILKYTLQLIGITPEYGTSILYVINFTV